MDPLVLNLALLARRRDEAGGGGMGFFLVLVILGIVIFLVLRGRRDKAEALGTPVRAMGSGPVGGQQFANPYPKCPTCGAAPDKMRQAWDGLRKVTWTCGYCGSVAGVQELRDEELPPCARQRLGLDAPQGMAPGQPGYYPPQGGGMGGGGLLTGMMIGSMLGGERRYRGDDGGWTGGGEGQGQGGPGNDWGENDVSGGGGGSDWGDSGGGDSGGGDSGGDF